jgi:poly(beta-D-mannuronate) lyase
MACAIALSVGGQEASAEDAIVKYMVTDPNASYFDVSQRRAFLREHERAAEFQPLNSRYDGECMAPDPPISLRDPVSVPPLYKSNGERNPRWSEGARPFHEVRRTAIAMAKSYVVTGNGEAARCLGDYLVRLAALQALTRIDDSTRQGWYTVAWTATDIALAYSIVRGDSSIGEDQRRQIESWLKAVVSHQVAIPGNPGLVGDCCNNHLYWRGLEAAATGIVTQDADLLTWGIGAYRNALRDMNPDGSFPGEMGRGARALHYQSFAIWPLVITAELAERQGYDLYGMDFDGKTLHLAIDFLMRALADPSILKPYTAKRQNMEFASFLPWAEIYQRRFPRPDLRPYIGQGGGEISMFGGPLTLYFFHP